MFKSVVAIKSYKQKDNNVPNRSVSRNKLGFLLIQEVNTLKYTVGGHSCK